MCCARRLSLCVAAVDTASDAVSVASLPAAARYLPRAGHEGGRPKRRRFKRYPIGFFHIDIAEVQTAEGKLYLFVGIDAPANSRSRSWSIRLTGAQRGSFSSTAERRAVPHPHHSDEAEPSLDQRIEPASAKAGVERMNRTMKVATVKALNYESHDQLRTHLADFMAAHNFCPSAQDAKRGHP